MCVKFNIDIAYSTVHTVADTFDEYFVVRGFFVESPSSCNAFAA